MSGRYRVWPVIMDHTRLRTLHEQAAEEINRLHRDHGWEPLSIAFVSSNLPEFAVLFDTRPRSEVADVEQ